MTDRDKEIEQVAIMCAADDTMRFGVLWDRALIKARMIIEARDEWRSTRNQLPAPAAAEPTPPADLKALAEKIAANLFSDMYDRRVDRLVLTYDDPKKDMGGLCFGAARDRVLEVLKAEPTPPAMPTDRMGWLEMYVRVHHELRLDGCLITPTATIIEYMFGRILPSWPSVTSSELTRLQALAAELTAKDGRDG